MDKAEKFFYQKVRKFPFETYIVLNKNETGSRSPCMRPRSDPPNFGPIERGEKQTNNID